MIFKNYQPSPILRSVVKQYQVRHFRFSSGSKIPVKTFAPRAEQYMNFYIRGGEEMSFAHSAPVVRSATSITGQYTHVFQRCPTHEFLMVQVPFFPGMLFRLTGVPFEELRDCSLDLSNLYPIETREVEDRLHDATSYEQLIAILDDFLIRIFAKSIDHIDRPFDKILPLIGQVQTLKRIDLLADQACLSTRQFERLSRSYFGVTPKMMMRISRFSSTVIMRSRNPQLPWLDVAIACGYEDYQHMVRDYKTFAGIAPNQFWELDQKGPERVLGLR